MNCSLEEQAADNLHALKEKALVKAIQEQMCAMDKIQEEFNASMRRYDNLMQVDLDACSITKSDGSSHLVVSATGYYGEGSEGFLVTSPDGTLSEKVSDDN